MPDNASGVLKLTDKGAGVLRDPARSFRPRPDDVQVPIPLVREHELVAGATLTGPVREGEKAPELTAVETICGLSPEEFKARPRFNKLVAIHPDERFDLAKSGETSLRIVDMLAPIGKGTRGLVVSPPKAGKTVLLGQIARAIRLDVPDSRIIVLLIDERPEEVTDFRRSVDAEVLSSTNDQSAREHVALAELTLAHIRTELECGRDVVVLVDSLTRIGRSFNIQSAGKGRTMSGGMEAGALEIPRKFFGLARNIENGGSVTIIATILIDTGSRMDQLIFEEFKGTGNSEIVLDRSLADARIFPAIDLPASGTRREEQLHTTHDYERIAAVRRTLADLNPRDAMTSLLEKMRKYPTNKEFLESIRV